MRAFVTGATGFIGANLTRRLLRDGHAVSVLLRNPSSAYRPLFKNCRVITGDLMNTSGLRIGMESCDVVFHLAAYTSPVSIDPSLPYRVNVTGSLNILKAAEERGVRKMIMCSTAGTLGYSPSGEILDESSARYGIPGTEYEITKAKAEEELLAGQTGRTAVVIVKPTRVYGPGKLTQANSMTRIMDLYGKGLWRIMPGDGYAMGNYVFIGDVVEGLVLAAEKGREGETYILGGENLSYTELFSTLGELYGKTRKLIRINRNSLKIIIRVAGIRPINRTPAIISDSWIEKYLRNYVISSNKAVSELGYVITPFREGALITISWLKSGLHTDEPF